MYVGVFLKEDDLSALDVTFRETEPFYGRKEDLNSLFGDDSPSTGGTTREGEKQKGTKIVTLNLQLG